MNFNSLSTESGHFNLVLSLLDLFDFALSYLLSATAADIT